MGGHALPVATAITVQDTSDLKGMTPVGHVDLIGQARAVLEDVPVKAFKIGLLGSLHAIEAVHGILADYPDLPVVLDPVCASRAGTTLVDDEQLDALVSLLLPRTRVVTPSVPEARLLAPEADSPAATAQQLMSYGCEHVLLSGAHARTSEIENRLYGEMRLMETFRWKRLPGAYHGAGCTLSAALAALLAHGLDVVGAAHQAQQYTWDSLAHGQRIGAGPLVPDRLHWAAGRGAR
jgi:hydroxymethylpyrimidine/phosphomethylpyrimidine kinase